jgi:hypothetical protein
MGLWSSYVTHTKHLPIYLLLESWPVLPLAKLRFSLYLLPIVEGVALDVLGNREVKQFRNTNASAFASILRNAVSVTLAVFRFI